MASAAGIVIWNGLFIGIGYFAFYLSAVENTTVLTLVALGCLLVVEIALLWVLRKSSGRRKATASSQRAHAATSFPSICGVQEHRL